MKKLCLLFILPILALNSCRLTSKLAPWKPVDFTGNNMSVNYTSDDNGDKYTLNVTNGNGKIQREGVLNAETPLFAYTVNLSEAFSGSVTLSSTLNELFIYQVTAVNCRFVIALDTYEGEMPNMDISFGKFPNNTAFTVFFEFTSFAGTFSVASI